MRPRISTARRVSSDCANVGNVAPWRAELAGRDWPELGFSRCTCRLSLIEDYARVAAMFTSVLQSSDLLTYTEHGEYHSCLLLCACAVAS